MTSSRINANDVISRYQQALADATHRAILAEATLAQALAERETTAPEEGQA